MSNSNKYTRFESVDRCITKYTYKGENPRFRVRCKHKGLGTFDTLEEAQQCRDKYEFGNLKRTGKYRCHEIYGNSRQTIIEKYKKIQEQLNEANEAIKTIRKTVKEGEFPCDACGYSMACDGCWCGDIADDYLKKWGVK